MPFYFFSVNFLSWSTEKITSEGMNVALLLKIADNYTYMEILSTENVNFFRHIMLLKFEYPNIT